MITLSSTTLDNTSFAGRGTYTDSATGDRHPGSPIRALALFEADEKLRSCVDVLFVESDESMYKELREAVEAFVALHTGTRAPAVVEGRFADQVPPFLSQLRQLHGGRLPPTFLFVDPCGVEGVDFKTIASVLREPTCELFLFFNSAGLRRIIGADKGQGESPTLLQLYGDPLTVKGLLAKLAMASDSAERERLCLDEYRRALKSATGAQFFLPFPIESADRMDTSHYLLHASKSPLGFKIMKHVMLETLGESPEGGILGHRQASTKYASSEIRFDLAELRHTILAELQRNPRQVDFFYNWVSRPTDYYSEKSYKRELLALEAGGRIAVFEDSGQIKPKPVTKRVRNGQITLGAKLWVAPQ